MSEISPTDVTAFWSEAGPKRWFTKDGAFDEEIRTRFEELHHAAARRELHAWGETAEGSLALVLLLDQVPRNIYRGSAHAFATDPLARALSRSAVGAGFDKQIPASLRTFFYLPFSHSESLADQNFGMPLWNALGSETGAEQKWAFVHRDIIVRFGRFPHRNPALGRETSPEEQAFLDEGGFAG
ncbi:MAG: DUF924 family protein [Caulobacteraceae bacterium]